MGAKILTISIAAYNVENTIDRALSSCLDNRTLDDVEVLVIDDGATDATVERALEWREKFPDVVRIIRKKNGGYGSVINTAIKEACGKYLKQLDGDDWFDQKGLLSLVTYLKRHDADLILTPNIKYFESTGNELLRDNANNTAAGVYEIEKIRLDSTINMHSVAYRTNFLRQHEIRISEHCFYTDTELVLRPLPFVKTVLVLHDPVYYYRIGAGEQSMSIEGIRKHFDDHTKVFDGLCVLSESLNDHESNIAHLIRERVAIEASNHYRYFGLLKMSANHLRELLEFDSIVSSSNLTSDVCRISKSVKLLKTSNFILYPLFCLYERHKARNG